MYEFDLIPVLEDQSGHFSVAATPSHANWLFVTFFIEAPLMHSYSPGLAITWR